MKKVIRLFVSIALILSVTVANATVINHSASNEENKSKEDTYKKYKLREDPYKKHKSKEEDKSKENKSEYGLVSCPSSESCGLDIPKGIDELGAPPKYEDIKSDNHCNEKSPNLCQINHVDKLSSIPEPSTYALFSIGIVGLIYFARRQAKVRN
ncbi:MAG: PEP-CTERM protein-sorting domain-containing protein [Candidatus Nitrotoga sp. MKT]|nr:MAG: PEP-CTERM protein-sorting domain-containing protein [Candidatus Nitrotoga sp. MKT]